MTDQPARVTPAEISALLDQARGLTRSRRWPTRSPITSARLCCCRGSPPPWTPPEAHRVAADAWQYVGELARQRDRAEVTP